MSVRTLFARAAQWILATPRGTKIKDADGQKRDTQVQPFAEDLLAMFRREGPIELYEPLQIINNTDGPAIEIINKGPTDQTAGVKVVNEAGQGSQLGIGLGNINIVANEYIPTLFANIDPTKANQVLGQGNTVRYGDLDQLGVDRPPESAARSDDKVDPGFSYQKGQDYQGGDIDRRYINLTAILAVNKFFQSFTKVNNSTYTFTWNNIKYYATTSDAMANGLSDTLTVVSDVTCDEEGLHVTQEEWTFQNGILIDVS